MMSSIFRARRVAAAPLMAVTSFKVDPLRFVQNQIAASSMNFLQRREFIKQAVYYYSSIASSSDDSPPFASSDDLPFAESGDGPSFITLSINDSLSLKSKSGLPSYLSLKLSYLDNDGMHENGLRQTVLLRYYKAHLALKGALCKQDKKNAIICEDGISYHCGRVFAPKANGFSIIAKHGNEVIGEFFMANAIYHDHFVICEIPRTGFKDPLIMARMFDIYSKSDHARNDGTKASEIKISCVLFCSDVIAKFAGDRKSLILDCDGKPQVMNQIKRFYDRAKEVIKDKDKIMPSPSVEISDFDSLARSYESRDIE